jgi:peroxiredoxin
VAAQAAFAKAQKIEFELLSDPDASVGAKYGALRPRPRRPAFARRVTFIIDDQGVLRHIDEKVDVRGHGAALVRIIEKLKAG